VKSREDLITLFNRNTAIGPDLLRVSWKCNWTVFYYAHSAMLQRDLVVGEMSVCLSVTCWYRVKTNNHRWFSPTTSLQTCFFRSNFIP